LLHLENSNAIYIERSKGIMKHIGKTVSLLFFVASLAGIAVAGDGVLAQDRAGDNYCHMKFPAIRSKTLATSHPTLKSPTTGDVIDYSGSCDESPTGQDQVAKQRFDESRHFSDDYNE
jgi:hypothetical protein